MFLMSRSLPISKWQTVLPVALHSIRSLLCTVTNETPHERFFKFNRRSSTGESLPAWLTKPGSVLLKRQIRNKNDPLVDEVELLHANPEFAFVRLGDGKETSVSIRHLAPCPRIPVEGRPLFSSGDYKHNQKPLIDGVPVTDISGDYQNNQKMSIDTVPVAEIPAESFPSPTTTNPLNAGKSSPFVEELQSNSNNIIADEIAPRRSGRVQKPVVKLNL